MLRSDERDSLQMNGKVMYYFEEKNGFFELEVIC